MKKLILGVFACACASAVFAETKTWTGGGDGTSWSDVANWDEKGAPVSGAGDDVVISFSAATADLTMETGEAISIGTLKITPTKNAVLTLEGGAITFTHQADITDKKDFSLQIDGVSGGSGSDLGCKVRILNDIVLPAEGGYTIERGYNWDGYNGVELAGVISGAGTANFWSKSGGQNYFVLSGHNTYTGGTYLKLVRITFNTLDALSDPSKAVAFDSGRLSVDVAGTFPYTFDLAEPTKEKWLCLNAANDWSGGLIDSKGAFDCTVAGSNPISIYSKKNGSNVTCSGDINLPNGDIRPGAGNSTTITFSGTITCRKIYGHDNDNVNCGNKTYARGGHAVGEFGVGVGTHHWQVDNAFSGADLHFCGQWLGTGAILQLNGHPQTLGNVYSDINGSAFTGHAIQSTSAARVTARPDRDCLAACLLTDNITFAVDAADPAVTLTLTNRVHSMKGNLIVSNGTLHVNGETTFKKVSALEVAGGTLDLDSTAAAAFDGVTSITIGKCATLRVRTTVPFASSGVTVRMDGDGRIDVAEGLALNFDAVYVDDASVDGGTYSGDSSKGTVIDQITGSGTVTVPETEVPTKTASWTGNGDDANVTTLANWSSGTTAADLVSKGLYPTFAEAGDEAAIGSQTYFKGLVFDIPGGAATNEFALTGTGPLGLYNLGITVAVPKTDEQYRYTLDVPVQIKKPQTWTLPDTNAVTLSVAKPLSGGYKLSTAGKGNLEMRAESPAYDAVVSLSGVQASVYAAKDAFGKASTGNQIELNSLSTGAKLYLYGTTIEKPLYWENSNGIVDIHAMKGTNVLKGVVTVSGTHGDGQYSNNTYINVASGAVLRTEGEWTQSFDPNKWWSAYKYGQGTLEVAGRSYVASYYLYGGTVRISAVTGRGGSNPCGSTYVFYTAPSRVEFTAEKLMNTDWNGVQFYSSGTLDLCGFDQKCGNIIAGYDSIRGKVHSETPATLTVVYYDDGNMRKTEFTGAVSLVVASVNSTRRTVTMAGVSSTTGSLAVQGTATLAMTADASWLNPSEGAVTVSGSGILQVNRSRTFSRHLDLSLAGSGVIELAAGVRQRFAHLYLDGASTPAAAGEWGAIGSGAAHESAHIAGEGRLSIGPSRGSVILLK